MKKYILLLAASMVLATVSSYAQPGTIVTYTTGSYCNIAVDGSGRLYSAVGTRVCRIDSGGTTTVVAGTGISGYSGDGGAATAAKLSNANHLAFDNLGNMFIADGGNGTIRKVNSAGIISTVAGTGTTGYTGDGGPATAANIRATTVCPDVFGNIYIADITAHRVRKVSASGTITTVAGNGTAGYSGDGGPATAASLDHYTETNNWGMAADNAGNLYISAGHNYRVRKVSPAGIITTYAGNGATGSAGIGGPATAANVYYPQGLTMDASGNLYIAEWQNCVLAVVNSGGILNTVAGNYTISFSGDGGPATAAGMNAVSDVALDPYGNIYIADCHNSRVRKIINAVSCSGTPSPGTATPNTLTACATTGISITLYGYSGGIGTGLHWQQSPDSVTWSDIAGATSATYAFAGLTSTTYYRCRNSCTSSGLSAYSPGVKITYTPVCPCVFSAGTIYANTYTACAATGIILTDTGYTTSGVTLQWQSSPDSVTWSNISGATAATYSFSGLSASTYYRCAGTCTASGTSLYTAGRKITYTVACMCSGTPVAGTATASTTVCSACSLTLNLSGSASLTGLLYQWEQSFDGTSGWASIAGATTVPYSNTPAGAYYYRCKVTCTTSGISAYSSPIFVGYTYSITADSISSTTDTTCNFARLFVRVNGLSTLLRVKTWYGDGQNDSVSLTASGVASYLSALHSYNTPGSYSVKRVLYYNNIPQDSVVRTYEHQYCKTIPIKLYLDYDGNCIKGGSEPFNSIPVQIQVDSNSIPIKTIFATSGLYYKATGPAGTVYAFHVVPGSRVATCPATGVLTATISATGSSYPLQSFGLSCGSGGLSDLAASVVVPVTGRHDQWGHIYLRNNYCVSTNATVTLKYSFKYSEPASWHLAPTTSLHPVLTWDIAGVTASAPQTDMYFVGWAPASAYLVAGDTVVEEIIVTSTTGTDCDTTNNHIIRVDTVKASCDPNLIEVAPAACFDTNTHFRFTIHFENTGNDTAYNIYVLDTLSDYLDPSTLKVVMSSAEVMNIYPYMEGGHNIIKFDFPGIKLLDSSWHGLNDGSFIYTIDLMPGMPSGASVFSRAGIYFDYNDVVMTNTVQNMKGCPPPTFTPNNTVINNNVLLYPNPATDELNIQTDGPIFHSCIISNITGRQLLTHDITGTTTTINVKMLPTGMYYVTLKGENGTVTRKFVK